MAAIPTHFKMLAVFLFMQRISIDPSKDIRVGDGLQKVIESVRGQGMEIIYLDVLDTNESAILFYEKLGFKLHSKHRLTYKYFKEDLKGFNRMFLELNEKPGKN